MDNNNAQWNDQEEDDFDLRGTLYKFLRYWYLFVIAGLLGFFAASEYLKRYTPIYQASATLLIKNDRTKPSAGDDIVQQFDMGGKKNIDNEIQILQSRPLLVKVVDNLSLTTTYWHEGANRDIELYKESPVKIEVTEVLSSEPFFIQPTGLNTYDVLDSERNKIRSFEYTTKVKSKYGTFRVFKRDSTANAQTELVKITFKSKESAVAELMGSLAVGVPIKNTTLVSLSLEDAVPAKAKDILSNILEEYTFTTLEDKNREASNTLRFIEERLKLVTRELGDVEQDVEQYRRVKGVTDLSVEGNLFLDQVQANDSKLNEIDINLEVLEGVDKYVRSNEVGNMAPATPGVNDPVLTTYIGRLSELEEERTRLSQTVQAGNPYLETINSQMRNVKQAMQENLRNQRSNLQVSRNSILAMNNRLEGSISTIPRKEREFLGIKRQAGVKESLYLLLLQKREETALSYASTVTDSRVVDPPYASPGPIRPDSRNIFMYFILVALMIPVAIVFVREMFKNTVQSRKEIEKKTGRKIFGEISALPKNHIGQLIDLSSRSFISEQIRMIRSNLQYLFVDSVDGRGHTLLITSSAAGEGKTFVTLNLAQSLALLNKRVVILGLDLRKPKINEYLQVSNKKGISNYLIGQAKADDIVQATPFDNLFLAPSGPIPPNPSELVSTDRLRTLIEDYRDKYDYIVIDTPPVGLVTDTTLMAPLADAVFYVVRHEKTLKSQLNMIADLAKQKQFKSLNLIFNAVNYKNSAEYGYGYGYGYGNGGYYESSEPESFMGKASNVVKKGRKRWGNT